MRSDTPLGYRCAGFLEQIEWIEAMAHLTMKTIMERDLLIALDAPVIDDRERSTAFLLPGPRLSNIIVLAP